MPKPGAVLVDMTTSEPSLAIEIAETAATRDVHALDAPVSGGDVGARNASLSIMVGGPPDVFDVVLPCLEAMGSTIVRQGGHGAGQHTKMVNQILIASTMVAMSEGLLYAARVGLDVEQVLTSVASGAAGSWALSNLAPRVIAGDFAPGFLVDHFVKDLGIALAEAQRAQLALPGLALGEPALRRAPGPRPRARRHPSPRARVGLLVGPHLAAVTGLTMRVFPGPVPRATRGSGRRVGPRSLASAARRPTTRGLRVPARSPRA